MHQRSPLTPLAVAALTLSLTAGCARREGFRSPEPSTRIQAIAGATSANDESAIPNLIEQLDSDDPAVRLFAILALERLTGQTLGYHHAAPERERREAVGRWVAWEEARRAADDGGASAAGGAPSAGAGVVDSRTRGAGLASAAAPASTTP